MQINTDYQRHYQIKNCQSTQAPVTNPRKTQPSDVTRRLDVERLQHYDPEVEQRVQGWLGSGQLLVWIPILSQEPITRKAANPFVQALSWMSVSTVSIVR